MTPAAANCPMIAWCLGVLVVKGFEGIAVIDPLTCSKKDPASALQ
jgi:hypothetical protein